MSSFFKSQCGVDIKSLFLAERRTHVTYEPSKRPTLVTRLIAHYLKRPTGAEDGHGNDSHWEVGIVFFFLSHTCNLLI